MKSNIKTNLILYSNTKIFLKNLKSPSIDKIQNAHSQTQPELISTWKIVKSREFSDFSDAHTYTHTHDRSMAMFPGKPLAITKTSKRRFLDFRKSSA